jgi:hypothetical protein
VVWSSYIYLAATVIMYAHLTFLFISSEENVERDAVHKALMSLIRQDVKSKSPMATRSRLMRLLDKHTIKPSLTL